MINRPLTFASLPTNLVRLWQFFAALLLTVVSPVGLMAQSDIFGVRESSAVSGKPIFAMVGSET